MSAYSEEIRAKFKAYDDIRDAGLTTPEEIERFDNIPYGEDISWQVLDVYRRKDAVGQKLPIIVSVHGGGWVYGDKERYQYYCMDLAMRGFAVVNFTYRLAPEYKFPAPLEDTNLVIDWIFKHAKEYGLDTEHIFGVGDSAGAHILALYANICTNAEYAAKFEFTVPGGFVPTAIALNCGVYEVEAGSKNMEEYMPEKGTQEEVKLINVEAYVTQKYPPVFLMTSTGDFLKFQALIMAKRLTECNVPFFYGFYGNQKNQLGHVFHCDMRSTDGRKCNDDECDFFKRYL